MFRILALLGSVVRGKRFISADHLKVGMEILQNKYMHS